MRPAKQFLVDEVEAHLRKSDYVYLANFDRITVADVGVFREKLRAEQAEFHVVKNSVLRVAAKKLDLPDLEEWLIGPTAIIVGGGNPTGVARVIRDFTGSTQKGSVKVGVLEKRTYGAEQVKVLADLPSLDVLRAQLLSLFSTPARSLLFVFNAVPSGILNVLQARVRESEN
jgi:large subunit ribosomal protein L10